MQNKEFAAETLTNYFLRLAIPIVLVVSIAITSLLVWNDYKTNKFSKAQSQKIISETFISAIRQPLLQGSFIEVKIRAKELLNNVGILCVQVKINSEYVVDCDSIVKKKSGYNEVSTNMYFDEENKNEFSEIKIIFDNSDLISNAWKKAWNSIFGFILLAVTLFFALTIVFKRIRYETSALLKITKDDNESNSEIDFNIKEFKTLGIKLKNHFKEIEARQKLQTELSTWMSQCEEKDLVCKQIHHDLASPLGLLKVSIQRLGDQSLAKAFALSLDRISKISEDLKSQKYIWASENPKLETAQSILNTILEEKRLLTSKFKINFNVKATQNALNQTIDIPVSQLHRVLSNILNNAIEAVRPLGTIKVLVRYSNNKMDLIITDSGSGIAKEHANQIFEKQKSFNKPQGSGLGLYHAKLCIESFGGKLILLNTKRDRKHGAAFLLRLPVSKV